MSKTERKINLDQTLKILAFLGGAGFFTWAGTSFDAFVANAVVRQMADPKSEISLTIADTAKSISERIVAKEASQTARVVAFASAFDGFKNMDTEHLVEYMEDQFDFADSIRAKMSTITANHAWVASQREKDTKHIMCGYVLADKETGKPVLFKDCDGSFKNIYYGKVNGSHVELFYYRNDNDTPVVISILGNKVTRL